MEKELALAVNFAKVPKKLQEAATSSVDILTKLLKKQAALEALKIEIAELEKKQSEADRAYRKLVAKWDPASPEKLPEDPVVVAPPVETVPPKTKATK